VIGGQSFPKAAILLTENLSNYDWSVVIHMNSGLKKLIFRAARRLLPSLRDSLELDHIETELIRSLCDEVDWFLFVAGRNREGGSGQNVIRRNNTGSLVCVLNVLDGHVNYLRGGHIYAASVSICDINTGERHSVIVSGIDLRLRYFDGLKNGRVFRPQVHKDTRPVVGIGQLSLGLAEQLQHSVPYSIRALGCTSLSLIELAQGRIDVFLCRTKLWNCHWALPLVFSGDLNITVCKNGKEVDFNETALLTDPAQSIRLIGRRAGLADPQCLSLVQSLIASW